jgi:hypothetical protein
VDGANERAAREALPRSGEQVWGWSHDEEGRREELDAAVPRATSEVARDWQGVACARKVAGLPFYRQSFALVRRPGAPRAALTAGGGLPVGQRGSAVRREWRRGTGWVPTSRRLGARGASRRATSRGREPREGARGGAGRPYGTYSMAWARPVL